MISDEPTPKRCRLTPETKLVIAAYLKGQHDAKGIMDRHTINRCVELFNVSRFLAHRIWEKCKILESQGINYLLNPNTFKFQRTKFKDFKKLYGDKLKISPNDRCKSFRDLTRKTGIPKSTAHTLYKLGLLKREDGFLVGNIDSLAIEESLEVESNNLTLPLPETSGEAEHRSDEPSISLDQVHTESNVTVTANTNQNSPSLTLPSSNLASNNAHYQSKQTSTQIQTTTTNNNNENITKTSSNILKSNNQLELKIDGIIEDEFSD